ncbi:hypothetical protein ABIE13_000448 [Ottowia thiooxydans]|uniref:Uncharacterized protein n=1 Tax=Ottowia thiooxydans TaxID=219182 RepID=A0ABV2Q2U1_9BURK
MDGRGSHAPDDAARVIQIVAMGVTGESNTLGSRSGGAVNALEVRNKNLHFWLQRPPEGVCINPQVEVFLDTQNLHDSKVST